MPPSQCYTIKTLWSQIEEFLELPSVVATSQTCKALEGEIVDADTRRIKVSNFVEGKASYGLSDGACERVPNYLPYALNSIHWPSVKSINLRFSKIVSQRSDVRSIESSTASCFPLLVSQLAYARNLESLQLDVREILDNTKDEDSNNIDVRYEPLIALLGHNLMRRCPKLKDLGVTFHQYCPLMLRELVLALTPLLRKQKYLMNRIQFEAWDEDMEDGIDESHQAALVDFFSSILSCTNLRVLDIMTSKSWHLTKGLLNAVKQTVPSRINSFKKQKIQRTGRSGLHRLCLCLWGMYEGFSAIVVEDLEQYVHQAGLLFDNLLCDCRQLEDVKLGAYSKVWEAHSGLVSEMLSQQPKLSALTLYFGGHNDSKGKMLELARVCATEGDKCKVASLQIMYLREADGKSLFQMADKIWLDGGEFPDFVVSDTHDPEQRVSEDMEVEDFPEKVDIDYLWMRHDANFRKRERELGPWY